MRNRLRIEVKKNGKRVGVVGVPDRGVLSATVDLQKGSLTASAISVRGNSAWDEHLSWSFGKVAVGDVITLQIVPGGPISRPDERDGGTPERKIASDLRFREFIRAKRRKRLATLEKLLRTRKFRADPGPRASVGSAALRVLSTIEKRLPLVLRTQTRSARRSGECSNRRFRSKPTPRRRFMLTT